MRKQLPRVLMMKLEYGVSTHPGGRGNNEDASLVQSEDALFAVADGMGGCRDGEIASRMTVAALSAFFGCTREEQGQEWPISVPGIRDLAARRVVSAVKYAHREVRAAGARSGETDPAINGMGSTVVALHLSGPYAYLAHVGDSRCYWCCGGNMRRLTTDHTLVAEMTRSLRAANGRPPDLSRFGHVLTRAVGMKTREDVDVDLSVVLPGNGDVFLLCTDGLFQVVGDADLKRILMEEANAADAATRLVGMATARGGLDNITALVVRVADASDAVGPRVVAEMTTDG